MKEVAEAITILAIVVAALGAAAIYWSPYNQCVRGKSTMNSDREIIIYPYPKSLAQFQCAKAIGGAPE